MTTLTGKSLGRYHIEERLGRGGMAEVYKARDEKLGRTVAVKVILADLLADDLLLKRFMLEARVVAQLDHPNILPIYDFGEHEGRPFLVMPYLDQGSLSSLMSGIEVPLAHAVSYVSQLAEALDAAHEAGVLHRDVKPANVLMGKGGRLFLADFGIAKMLEGEKGLTATGMVVGTPTYMAPETAAGKPATAAADRYSLAVVAFELICGKPPFDGDSALSVLHQHVTAPAPLPSSVVMGLPKAIDDVLKRGLAKDPEKRHRTCQEFASNLRGAAGEGSPVSHPASAPAELFEDAPRFTPFDARKSGPSGRSRSISLTTPAGENDPGLTSAATVATRRDGGAWRRIALVGGAVAAIAAATALVFFLPGRDSRGPATATQTAAPLSPSEGSANPGPTPPSAKAPDPGVSAVPVPALPEEPSPPALQPAEPQLPLLPEVTKSATPPKTREPSQDLPDSRGNEVTEKELLARMHAVWRRFIPSENSGFRPVRADFAEAEGAARNVLRARPDFHEAAALERFAQGGIAYLESGTGEGRRILIDVLSRRAIPPKLRVLREWSRNAHDLPDWMVALAYQDARFEAAPLLEAADPVSDPRVHMGKEVLKLINGEASGVSRPRPRPGFMGKKPGESN